MMSNLRTPWGGPFPPPKKKNLGGKIFYHPLRVRGVVKTFPGNSPWKGVPKTGFKILRVPPRKICREVKISPNFAIFRLFRPFLKNGARYCQSENWFLICGHSSTRWWSEEMVYVSPAWITWSELEDTHPPIYSNWRCSGVKGHSLQILTSGSGSWCLTYVPLEGGPLPPKKFGGRNFFPTP